MSRFLNFKRLVALAAVMALAVLSTVSIALADNVQNDVVASGTPASKTVTVTAGGTGATVNYRIADTANDSTDTTGQNGVKCNAIVGSATVTPAGMPTGVSVDPTSVTFDDCSTEKGITFTAGAATVPGSYPITVGVTDSNNTASDYNTSPGSFTLVVEAASTPPPPPDVTDPTIDIVSPLDGAVFTLNQAVNAEYSCADEIGGSGLKSCVGTVPNGDPIDTSSVGAKPFTVDAEDNAGNDDSQTNNYSVVYDFSGFFRPIDNGGVLNVAKAGSSIPVKFSLAGDQGLNILAAGSPKSERVECDATSPTDALETLTAGNSSLSYNATTDQYNYVWKTDKGWAGTCRKLTVSLVDGTSHTALFKLTK